MNIDATVPSPVPSGGGSAEKPPRKTFDTKTTADIRKSLESLVDDKAKNITPPPVLGKKPSVPIKKSPSITTVTGIFSGLKQKVKSVESKLSSGSSHDSMDGIGSSRLLPSQIADNNEKGVTGEKIKRDDSELLDQVERNSMLQDMRANRAKAPKRRPPTSGLSNQNSIAIDDDQPEPLNTNPSPPESPKSELPGASDDELAKPKPRGWEKNRAPWMAELKANQMKKTSPNVEPRKLASNDNHVDRPAFAVASNRKSLETSSNTTTTTVTSNGSSHFEMRANSIDTVKAAQHHHETNNSMTKSMSSIGTTKISIIDNNNSNNLNNLNNNINNINNIKNDAKTDELIMNNNNNNLNNVNNNNVRPTSVNLRNRSISPMGRSSANIGKSTATTNSTMSSTATITSSTPLPEKATTNNIHNDVVHPAKNTIPTSNDSLNTRVTELESRVIALEKLVTSQKVTIDSLTKKFQDESDKVKTLKTELEKYAQCVTQV